MLALLLAVPGVYLLTGVQLEGEPLGVLFAFANALLFALYIVLAHRASRLGSLPPIDALAAAMLVAALFVTPIGGWEVLPALADPVAILAGIGVGLTSSVIPYVSDQLAMRRLSRATYALMVSLLPATATVIGIVVLAQVPTWAEAAGVALVIAGVAVHTRAGGGARGGRPAGRGRVEQMLGAAVREATALEAEAELLRHRDGGIVAGPDQGDHAIDAERSEGLREAHAGRLGGVAAAPPAPSQGVAQLQVVAALHRGHARRRRSARPLVRSITAQKAGLPSRAACTCRSSARRVCSSVG